MKWFWSQALIFFSVSGFWQVKHRLPHICFDCDSIVKELGPLVAGIWAHDCHANCISLWWVTNVVTHVSKTSSSLVLALTEPITCHENYWCNESQNMSLGFSFNQTDLHCRFSGRNASVEFIHLDMQIRLETFGTAEWTELVTSLLFWVFPWMFYFWREWSFFTPGG